MEDVKSSKFGEILINRGIIDKEKLYEALEIQKQTKKRLGEILVDKGFITEQQLIETLSQAFRLPVINAAKAKIEDKVLKIFPYRVLELRGVVPIALEEDSLLVATSDPLDLSAIQELKNLSGFKIKLVLSSRNEIKVCLNKYFGPFHSAEEAIKEIVFNKEKEPSETGELSVEELEITAQEAPTVRFVNSIIGEAIKQAASDIHFEPQRENMRVRFRIDGVLYEKVTVPRELQPAIISRIKIISGMDIAERRKPQDGRMSVSGGGKEIDIRASTLPDIFGEKVVLRLLDKGSIILPLESLGMFADELEMLKPLIYRPYGIVLVTGPTGSGKTTTLYSILNTLNDATRNIVTVEEPVEYELDGINQTSINVRAGYTFATAIRHILRQDPDVIMIGEIRDLETAEIAIQAALTGHLVLSTIHTNNAPGVINRLIDMNVEPFLISSAVIGVVAQRLVRRLCPFCRKEYVLTEDMRCSIAELSSLKGESVAKPVGCEKCYSLGYSGRIALFELFTMDDDIRAMILKKTNEAEITRAILSKGMRTLRASGIKKALEKITSLDEVMRITVERV